MALLGYGLFLAVMWLVHGFVALLIAIKEDIVAVAGKVATFGRAVARPIIAVGRGIGACGRAVAGFVEGIVDWIRRVRS